MKSLLMQKSVRGGEQVPELVILDFAGPILVNIGNELLNVDRHLELVLDNPDELLRVDETAAGRTDHVRTAAHGTRASPAARPATKLGRTCAGSFASLRFVRLQEVYRSRTKQIFGGRNVTRFCPPLSLSNEEKKRQRNAFRSLRYIFSTHRNENVFCPRSVCTAHAHVQFVTGVKNLSC